MTERMKQALILADKCWGKAYRASPEFVEQYLEIMQNLLLICPVVMGDEFRAKCENQGLKLPSNLHHNTWVSGARAMQQMGWISPVSKVEPVHSHNHMPSVTLWRSNIFGDKQVPFNSRQKSLF
jgi:hypothetical protein